MHPLLPEDRWSVPISAIEHWAYCPRQAVLIWQEGYFESNTDTVRGDLAHSAVDRGGKLSGRDGARLWRSLPVRSDRLGMHGICDTVLRGSHELIPIEHKSGKYVLGGPADLQVAAQALCLREMFSEEVPHREVFAGASRRRYEVAVDAAIEDAVGEIVEQLRVSIHSPELPPALVDDPKCRRCSLRPGCLPEATGRMPLDLFTPRPLREHDE